MNVKIIGIDPGLSDTGIGIVEGQAGKVIQYAYGVVKTDSRKPQAIRLEKIYNRLQDLFRKETPDLLIVEDVFSLERYPKSGITLGKVCGVVLLAGQQAGVSAYEIPVREAKQVLTGNGNASKEQLEKAVRSILNSPEPIRPSHASDALGLALIGLFRYADRK
ncbi:MAG: crossover junction endodeoxyribonuclease RuvC [Desulfosarcinaceae bacterium]|jgi:crossover junction endodeoxyribonuclease RuvC